MLAGFKELYINADGQAIMCDGQLDFSMDHLDRFESIRCASCEIKAATGAPRSCSILLHTLCSELLFEGGIRLGQALLKRASDQFVRSLPSPQLPQQTSKRLSLVLELSDVNPSDQEKVQPLRWKQLSQNCTDVIGGDGWIRMRDRGELCFDRGFMGFKWFVDLSKSLKEDDIVWAVLLSDGVESPCCIQNLCRLFDFTGSGAQGAVSRASGL